ncbi:hypothetical protein D3C71_1057140 [compost metagenome]
MGQDASLNCRDQLFLAILQQIADGSDILGAEIDLRRDLVVTISALSQRADRTNQFERRVLSTCKVLDEAHDKAVLFRSLNNDGGD